MSNTLLKWKDTKTNQGLLVMGARQVGKTSSIEQFAAEYYESVIKIDFVETPNAVKLISGAKDLEDLIVRITSLASEPLQDGKTLLFFDEVQCCGDAVTWMRYLAKDDRFDVIYSGSLLGVEAYDYRSLPVGTIDIVEMFSLDFEEFCWACGVDQSLLQIIKQCFDKKSEVPDFLHEKFIDLFYKYVLVGGMPEAVQIFVSTGDTQALRFRQSNILDNYRADITRYVQDKEHAQRIKTIFNAVPAQLNKENRRFIVSGIDKRKRFEDMQSDFDWLCNAGVVIPVKKVTEAKFPLGLSREDSCFKFYMNDTGLLFSTFSAVDVQNIIASKNSLNFGQAFENVVAQELRAHGYKELYYFNTAKIGEVDFLVESENTVDVLPIEIKSGKYSTKHAALDRLLSVKNYGLKSSIVLHTMNVFAEEKVQYLPLYMMMYL